jgi:hypothetical protein
MTNTNDQEFARGRVDGYANMTPANRNRFGEGYDRYVEGYRMGAQERRTEAQTQTKRVNALMAAFRYGGKVDDLGKVDDRWADIDNGKWHAACDGATLYGFDAQYKSELVKALDNGESELAAIAQAYRVTAIANGYTV